MLGATDDFGSDSGLSQYFADALGRLPDEVLALNPFLVEQARDFLVGCWLEKAERKIFQLPLQLPDAKPVCERRIQPHRLARDRLRAWLLARGVVTQRLQTRRQAQQDDAQVVGHRQQHAAQRFCLLVDAVLFSSSIALPASQLGKLHQLAQIRDQFRHISTEARA